ncbi:glycosyltransferase [Serinibacter salmoneus]|uniref:glycosyltransferase n=1 Tax=Serinibacter salmoneus TaxID=556530 RepID=UPI000BF5E33B|nr:glycosyltransferase [Serinibacter salmoneus]
MSPVSVAVVCLHTDPFAPPGSGDVGGMNVVVRHTSQALAARGHRIEVITRRSDPDSPEVCVVDGVRVRRVSAGPPHPVPKGEHEGFIAPFRERLEDLEPVDVVHSHHWFSGMAALPVAHAWGVPHVQSFHSIAAPPLTALAEGERPESPGRLAGEAHLARRSDAVVAVSDAEATTAITRLGAPASRMWVVHPGVDPRVFHPLAEPLPAGGRPRVLLAARLEPLKGVDLAIRALARLPQPRPILQVAGGATHGTEYVDSLQALAAQLGVVEDVALLGPQSREELARLMREASIVLVPSHSETYGLVALEAAASGVPVVAGAVGGLREAVRDGVTGLLLPDREPRTWAEALARVLDSEDLRARMSQASRAHARERGWDTTAGGMLAAYCALLQESRTA